MKRLASAHAKQSSEELTDADKEVGKTAMMLKELARRALAGEKLD